MPDASLSIGLSQQIRHIPVIAVFTKRSFAEHLICVVRPVVGVGIDCLEALSTFPFLAKSKLRKLTRHDTVTESVEFSDGENGSILPNGAALIPLVFPASSRKRYRSTWIWASRAI